MGMFPSLLLLLPDADTNLPGGGQDEVAAFHVAAIFLVASVATDSYSGARESLGMVKGSCSIANTKTASLYLGVRYGRTTQCFLDSRQGMRLDWGWLAPWVSQRRSLGTLRYGQDLQCSPLFYLENRLRRVGEPAYGPL